MPSSARLPRAPWTLRRTRLVLAALLAAAATTGLVLLVPTGPADALAKIKCKQTTGLAQVDPIMAHGRPAANSSHLHQFFGNNSFLAMANPNTATYAVLAAGGTNCRDTADTAGYWTPVLRYKGSGKVVPSQAFTAYYRPFTGLGGPKHGRGEAFPPDTRLVATDDVKGGWSCGEKSGARSAFVQHVPDCRGLSGKPGLTLTAHISFPSCWDGVMPRHFAAELGDTRDNDHYTYPVKGRCPADFPREMVALTETIQFAYTGSGRDVELSSDAMMGTDRGRSMHADFWNTWDQQGLRDMVRTCVRAPGSTASRCG